MKKTQFIDAYRGIKKRLVSFLSIVIIVLIGAGAYYITDFMTHGSQKKGNDYYNELRYMDMQMVSSLGISDEQIKMISELDEVEAVEGIVQLNGKLGNTGHMANVVIFTSTESINRIKLIEGRLPENQNEVAIAEDLASSINIKLNDYIKLSSSFNDENVLLNDELKVVGIYNHPNYVRKNSTEYTTIIDDSLINQDVMNNLYTRVLIKQKGNNVNTFDDRYFENQFNLKNKLMALTPALEDSSIDYYKQIANERIDRKVEEVETQFADAQSEIDDAKKKAETELAKALNTINASQAELDAAYNQLTEAQNLADYNESILKQRAAGYNNIKEKVDSFGIDVQQVRGLLAEFVRIVSDLDDLMSNSVYNGKFGRDYAEQLINKLNALIDFIDNKINKTIISFLDEVFPEGAEYFRDYFDTLNSNAKELVAYLQDRIDDVIDGTELKFRELFDRIRSLLFGVKDMSEGALGKIDEYLAAPGLIEKGKQAIADAKWQISDGWLKYEDGKNRLASARKEFETKKNEALGKIEDAQKQLDDKKAEAQAEIEKARSDFDNLKCNWVLTDRRAEKGYNDLYSNTHSVAVAGKIFGILFGVVGAIVCFSTLIIIIEEERKLVGTSKAFGFKNHEILSKYLSFGVLSSFFGCILSIGLGIFGGQFFQTAIDNIGLFNISKAGIIVDYKKIAIITLLAMLASALVAIGACVSLLRSPASTLMKGQVLTKEKKKKEAKNTNGSLYSRLIIRNMINDKARVIISIIIVAGSVIVIGLGLCLRDSFADMLTYQSSRVETYDYRVEIGPSVTDEQYQEIKRILTDSRIDFAEGLYQGTYYNHQGKLDGLYYLVCDDSIAGFINILDVNTHEHMKLPKDGAIFQNRMVENDNLKINDKVVIYDDKLDEYEITYVDEYNNYIGRQIIMSYEAYEKVFNKKAKNNCFFIKLNGVDLEALTEILGDVTYDISYYSPHEMYDKFKSVVSLYNLIVFMMLGFAIMMSFMILTNLANIFVNRKKKELIVMRINGYSISKTKNYLSREAILTTVVGLILGVALGAYLSTFVIRAMEQPDTQFVRDFNLKAWIISAAIEAVFAFIVYTITFKKIDNLNFREIT